MKPILSLVIFACFLTDAMAQNTFPSSGNVGIGYSSPASPLTVVGSGNLVDISNNSDQNTFFYLSAPGASDKRSLICTGTAGRLSLGSGGANEYLSILNSGKVGIGTTTPLSKAHINISSSNTSYSGMTTGDISLSVSNSSNTDNNLNVISFLDAAGYGVAHVSATVPSQSGHTGRLFFSTKPSGSGIVQRMVIDENGKVGIGTTSPDQALTVNGAVHATRVKVETTVPGPDYVFEKSYSLPSLDAVKSYIDENKHLPEIPSAKEMEAKGIDVGEMNMLLLKKVEELTLYILEQDQRIKVLEEKGGRK